MALVLGFDAKIYRNTGTYESPVWNEITNVKDLTLGLGKNESDVSIRAGGGWKAVKGGLKEVTIEFGMVYDTADTDFAAILAAFIANTALEVAVVDGAITTNGTQGLRCTVDVIGFDGDQSVAEAVGVKVVLKPTYATNAPDWITVSA